MKGFYSIVCVATLGFLFACTGPKNPIDPTACKKKGDPCQEYNCLFVGCWCVPGEEGSAICHDSGKSIKSAKDAEAAAMEYMKTADPEAKIIASGEQNYGWYFVTFEHNSDPENAYLSVSPEGAVLWTACGI